MLKKEKGNKIAEYMFKDLYQNKFQYMVVGREGAAWDR